MNTGLARMKSTGRFMTVATWNIAAINNNPFEYWLTMEDKPEYEDLMKNVESFIESPQDNDVPVHTVFTEDMFDKLETRMKSVGWDGMDTVRNEYWEKDYKHRKIISQFLKDPLLGSKRLASMPDRVTNTIHVADSDVPACRPTVINSYDGDLSTLEKWFKAWEQFMFLHPLKQKTSQGTDTSLIPYQMLQPIKRAKYPDITEEEEKVSLPLQTVCGAIFDAILVHMMNKVSPTPAVWQNLKKTMVQSLIQNKVKNTLHILEAAYSSSDIISLQEVSSSFIYQAASLQSAISKNFIVVSPKNMDESRDQNSILFLNKMTFPHGASSEITALVESSFEQGINVPVAKGDILAITATDKDGIKYVIASFHGDTNGLATIPVVNAIARAIKSTPDLSDHVLIFGLDANTYEKGVPKKKQDVLEFAEAYRALGLTSCWGDEPNPRNYTTYNARTYLQPQLNKACKSSEKRKYGDMNPKDFILFDKEVFEVVQTWKDNTGKKDYVEDMAFPTLTFPSDHAFLATILKPTSSSTSA